MVTVLCHFAPVMLQQGVDTLGRPSALWFLCQACQCMAGLGKGGWQLFHNPEGQQDLPSQVFHHFAPGPFLRRSTYISHNGSIAWSSAEGAFRGHPRRCAEICRSTSYTYLNLCLSLEESACMLIQDDKVTRTGRSYSHTKGASPPALVEFNLVGL